MSIAASVKHVNTVARALTEGNRLVALKSEYAPVTEMTRSLQAPISPNGVGFCARVALESEEALVKANEIIVGADQEAIEDQVETLTRQINAMVFTARNVIVPTVDNLVNDYTNRTVNLAQPSVSVNVFKYNAVHSSAALVNHLMSKYAQIQAFAEYRTFMLNKRSAEDIITLVSENNPHLDQQAVVEWLLEVGAERITSVFNALFATSRSFEASKVGFMRPSNLPQQIDELLLAYCLAGALRDKPEDVVGESVSLKEWEKHLDILHELLGHRLLKAYERRAQDVKNGRLILQSDAADAMETGVVSVLVNEDVYTSWLSAGGDVQALLGAARYEPHLVTTTDIQAVSESLVKRWERYYPVLRQTISDKAKRERRNIAAAVIADTRNQAVEGFPTLDPQTLKTNLDAELRALKDEHLENPFRLFTELVCRVYYRNQPLYLEFFESMERYAKVHPEATGRELAIESVIEMVASWLASQITTVDYKPLVVPGATLGTEEANVVVHKEHEEIAEDLGVIVDEPEINEVADAEVEAQLEETEEIEDAATEEPEAAGDDEETAESVEEPAEAEETELESEDEEPVAEEAGEAVEETEAETTETEVEDPVAEVEDESADGDVVDSPEQDDGEPEEDR